MSFCGVSGKKKNLAIFVSRNYIIGMENQTTQKRMDGMSNTIKILKNGIRVIPVSNFLLTYVGEK
jgi:hypothetical protein